jgi:hypothetical protein
LRSSSRRPATEIVGVTADMATAVCNTARDARLSRPIGALRPGPVRLVVDVRPEYGSDRLAQAAAAVRATAEAAASTMRVSDVRPMNLGGEGDVS